MCYNLPQKTQMRKSLLLILVLTFCFVFGHYKIHSQENKNSGQNEQTQTNENISVTKAETPPIQTDTQPTKTAETNNTSQEQKETAKEYRDWIGTVVNSLLFVLVLVQAFISHRQLKAMKFQVDVMQEGLEETRKVIEQNERVVKASETQAETSRDALEHSKEILAVSERAYIGLRGMNFVEPFSIGSQPEVKIKLINGGRTPAFNISAKMAFLIRQNTAEFPDDFDKASDKIQIYLIPAGEIRTVEYSHKDFIVDKNTYEQITNGLVKLFVVASIYYEDFLKTKQVFTLCAVYEPKTGGFKEWSV